MKVGDLTAAILVGGKGTRLRSALGDEPKPLAPVGGRPFIHFLLDQLVQAGIERAVLCTGYGADRMREVVGDEHGGMTIRYSEETVPLGTAGSLRLALPLLEPEPVLIMNGDSFSEVSVPDLLSFHVRQKADGTVVLLHRADMGRYGSVKLAEEDRIVSFDEKSDRDGEGWINTGVYLLSHRLLAGIPAGRAVSIEKEMFPAWTEGRLFGFRTAGRFIDIGTPASYASAQEFFARGNSHDNQ